MAPRKAKDKADSKRAAAKQPTNRVTKRPPRGYHTFKNGMMNVKPKGREVEFVNKNQQSPLLRLPPEIRNKIWTIALGDMIFIPNRDWFARPYLWVAANPPRNHRLALLRTCRQVFCETALIPYKINTFIVPRYIKLRSFLRRMKTAHRRAVSTLQVEHSMSYGNPLTHVPLLSLLTGLERLKVVVTGYSNNVQNERYLSALKDQLSDLKASGASLEVSIDYQETIAYRNWYASLYIPPTHG